LTIRFITVCRDCARKKGPLVIIALISVDVLESLKDGQSITQLYLVRERRRALSLKEQTRLDKIVESF
jgi:hypothetical protein